MRHDLGSNVAAHDRISQALQHPGCAVFLNPDRQQIAQGACGGQIWIVVTVDLQTPAPRGSDLFQETRRPSPIVHSRELDVYDSRAAAGAFRDGNRLLQSIEDADRLVPEMGRIAGSAP